MWVRPFQVLLLQVLLQSYRCFLLQTNDADCPLNCSCTGHFTCSNESLLTVPWIPSTAYCGIYLNDNHISIIEAGTFQNQSTARSCQLQFDNNDIHTFRDGAFDGITNNSITFHLRNNNLTSIPKAFSTLKQLEYLFLSGNPLMHLDANVMVNIGHSLSYCSLDISHFNSWPHQLQYLTLIIGYIPFNLIPDNSFHGLENTLRNLEIHDSELSEIPHAICILHKLSIFNFSSNHHLDEINSQLTGSCFGDRLQISHLIFKDNHVKMFPVLQNMFQTIARIDANNNGFTIINGDALLTSNFTVYDLNLERNNFSRIPYAVNNFHSLRQLNMAYNSITSIDEPDLSKLENLELLNIKGNPLMYISQNSFIHNLKLTTLDISETKLHQIPVAIMSLTRLNDLVLDNTPIVCTCDMSYLKPWNQTIAISDTSYCYLSTEKIKDYLDQFLIYC